MEGRAGPATDETRGFDPEAFLRALAIAAAEAEGPGRQRQCVVPRIHATSTRPGERAKGRTDA